jgi:hypothetical protein
VHGTGFIGVPTSSVFAITSRKAFNTRACMAASSGVAPWLLMATVPLVAGMAGASSS